MRRFALILADLEQGLVGNGLNISVPERVRGDAGSAHGFPVGYTFLNLGADGAVIHEVPILDDLRSVVNGNLRILEPAVDVDMSDAHFGDLAGGASYGSLVALAARLGVVERSESFGGDVFDLFEKLLVSLA